MKSIQLFFSHSLYDYDKQKANLLKSVFSFLIIIHHLEKYHLSGIGIFNWIGIWVMYLFFAMSGYGLVISYIKKPGYINGFLRRSLPKIFIPYLITFVLFVIYRCFEGVDQIKLFKSVGLFSFIPTSWFIYILALHYIFFFAVFRYLKSSIVIKVILTGALVMGYVWIAPHLEVSHWRYDKCPAFIVGMIFALIDKEIKLKFLRWHAFVAVGMLLSLIALRTSADPFFYSMAFFLIMYVLPSWSIKTSQIIKFFSSISLEMFIIQYIPIYFVTAHIALDKSYINTAIIVALVLLLNIILASAMHCLIIKLHERFNL